MKNIRYTTLVLLFVSLLIGACNDEDVTTEGKAVFSYVTDGFQVTFTNFTYGATNYEWNFNDGSEKSSLSNPVHVFKAKGDYLVSLTAFTGEASSTFTDTVYVLGPNIKIDNNFSDWEYVEYLYEHEDGAGGTLKAIKAYADASNVNFYLEGNEDMELAVLDMYINTDNDASTGFQSWQFPMGSGAEFLLEGNFDPERPQDSAGAVYDYTGVDGGWGWTQKTSFSDAMRFSKILNENGVKAIEFSISRSVLGSMSGALSFAFFEMNAGWAGIGEIPVSSTGTSSFLTLEF